MALETSSAVGTSCVGPVVAAVGVGVGDIDVAVGSRSLLAIGYAWPFVATDSAS
jgi:hypothetical protein